MPFRSPSHAINKPYESFSALWAKVCLCKLLGKCVAAQCIDRMERRHSALAWVGGPNVNDRNTHTAHQKRSTAYSTGTVAVYGTKDSKRFVFCWAELKRQ